MDCFEQIKITSFKKISDKKCNLRFMNFDTLTTYGVTGTADDFKSLDFIQGDWICVHLTDENQEALNKMEHTKLDERWMFPKDDLKELFEWKAKFEEPFSKELKKGDNLQKAYFGTYDNF
jgi:hypothetical protein